MLTLIRATFKRMLRRPLRSALTVLAVALGSLAVTLALTLLQARNLATLPSDVFYVIAGEVSSANAIAYQLFSSDDLGKYKPLIPDAEAVEGYAQAFPAYLERGGQRFKVFSSAAVNPAYFNINPPRLIRGSFFTEADLQRGTVPLLIAESVAKAVFGQGEAVGQIVQFTSGFSPAPYAPRQVVGVFQDPLVTETASTQTYVYEPFPRVSSRFSDPPVTLIVKAKLGLRSSARGQALEATRKLFQSDDLFREFKGAVYTTTSTTSFFEDPRFDPQALLFTGFAIIMLIASLVGVFSIQLVDIAERTREIGMRRALGATRSAIVIEVLAYALVISVLGTISGTVLTAAVLPILQQSTGAFLFAKGLTFSPVVAAQVIALMLFVSIALGLYPAALASRLKPMDALREV